ncbi:hypothetical protein, partial [Bartonella sp. TT67HLJMS]|uniref:hypothetical protein n=1 Tax=Bartonella sp. TT67HLJMS TaxID=3243582 RepID=UPI0035D02338
MKKLYAPQAASELKRSRFSFVKVLSLAAAATFLSNVAPVFSANSDFRNTFLEGVNSAGVSYPQSIISVAGLNASSVSKDNYLTALNKAGLEKINAADDYANFLTRTLLGTSDESSKINVLTTDSSGAWEGVQDILRVKNVAQLKAPRAFVKEDFNEEKENADISALAFDSAITRQLVPVSDLLRGTRANTGVMLGNGAEATDTSSIAIGKDDPDCKNVEGTYGCFGAKALAERAIAIGLSAEAKNFQGIAIGVNAKVSANSSIAIGPYTKATEGDIIVMGNHAQATRDNSIVIGHKANSTGSRGVALGFNAETSAVDTVAIGFMSHASGKSSVAIGGEYNSESTHGPDDYTTAKSDYTTAVGAVSKAMGFGSTAIGHRAKAVNQHAISFGFYSEAQGDGAIAIGANSLVSVKDGIALGRESVSGRDAGRFGYTPLLQGPTKNTEAQWKSTRGGVSVGNNSKGITRQITGVAAGSEVTDAVNVSQLKDLEELVRKESWKLSIGGDAAKDVGADSTINFSSGGDNFKIKRDKSDANKIIFGLANDISLHTLTLGGKTKLDDKGLVITGGPKITTGGIDAGSKKITGIQNGTLSEESTEAVNGSQLLATNNEINEVRDSILVKQVAAEKSMRSLRNGGEGVITIGGATGGNEISILNKDNGARKISGLLDGAISETSTDAVNGSQLHTLGSGVASYFGGGAKYEGGAWTAPNFTVKTFDADGGSKDQNYNDVASAFAGVGSSITNVKNDITKQINNEIANVKGDALLWSETDKAFNAMRGEGQNSQHSKIKGLLGGDLTSNSTEAVNGGQLYVLGTNLANYLGGGADFGNGNSVGPTFKVKTFQEDGTEDKQSYQNVAEAFEGVNTAVTNVQNKLTEQVNNVITKVESESFVQQDETTHRLTIGAAVEGSEINIANKKKGDRILSGVQAATKDNEAVNKGQLDKGLKDLSNSLQSDESAVVHYDKTGDENGSINYTSVTLGGKDKTAVGLHNVADGQIAKGSHDAITGGQVNKIGEDVAKFLGGDAAFKDGALTRPTYKLSHIATDGAVTDGSFQGVGVAFAGLDKNIKTVNDRIKEVSEGVAQDSLSWSKSDNAFVALHGEKEGEKTNSKITSLADGSIVAGSSDAITGGQINTIAASLAKILGGKASFGADGTFTVPSYDLSTVSKEGEVTDKSYEGVETAFAGLDKNIKTVNDRIKEVSEGVAQDSLSWSNESNAFVALHGEKEGEKTNSKITSLANGDITASSSDAITGRQLYDLQKQFAGYFGGGAGYNEEGAWTAPTFKVKTIDEDGTPGEEDYSDVASAFAGVGTSITNVKNDITKQINNEIANVKGDSLVKKEADTNLITIGKEVEGSKITIANKAGAARTLSGVAAGTEETDAVNFSQLKDVKDQVAEISFVKQDAETKHINIGKETDGDKINIANNKNENRTLTGIKNGVLSEESTEAVNGSQLFETNNEINEVRDSILVKQVAEEKSTRILRNGGEGVVTIGRETGGSEISILNKSNKGRKISGLLDGAINENSDEAVRGSQLHTLGTGVAKSLGGGATLKDGALTQPTYKLSHIAEDGAVTDGSFQGVETAFAGLDKNIKTVNDRIKEVSEGVAQDSLSWSNESNAFVALHGEKGKKTNSKITSLAAGSIVSGSSDAITGGQVYDLQKQFAGYLGGGAGYNEEGKWQAPTFKVKTIKEDGTSGEGDYSDVASAFAGVGSSFTNIKNELNKEINKVVGDNLVKQDEKTKVINIGKEAEGTSITIANKAGADRTLSGVKEAANDNEAVNKGQLDKGLKDLSNSLQSDESAVVHYDKTGDENGSINYTSVTLGKGKGSPAVGLHNVADGKISKDSHDAITGGQVNKIGEDVAKFLGGDATFKDGSLTQPTYKLSHIATDGGVTEGSFQGVGTAFAGLDTNIKNVNARIKEVSEGVAHDSLLWSDNAHAFVAQHEKKKEEDGKTVVTQENSKITSLADGSIVAGSSDAVTGGQIYDLQKQFAGYLGGGAGYNEKGEWQAPNYNLSNIDKDGKVTDKSHTNVGSAFKGLDDNIKNVNARIKEVSQGVAQDSLVWNKDEKAFTAKHGEKEERKNSKITSLENGDLSEKSTDAVNGSQLHSTNTALAEYFGGDTKYGNGKWTKPDFKVAQFDADGKKNDAKTYHNVADAFEGVNNTFTTLNDEIVDVRDSILVKQVAEKKLARSLRDGGAGLITIGNETGGSEISVLNKENGGRKLSGLLGGAISETSDEAVSGSQLHTLGSSVASYFGGSASYENGAWVAPTFTLKTYNADGTEGDPQEHHNVTEAFAGIDKNFTNVNKNVQNIVNDFTEKVTNITESMQGDALLWNESEQAFVAKHGEKDGDKTNSKITSLADGSIASGSSDAVNGGQLHSITDDLSKILGGAVSFDGKNFKGLKYDLSAVSTDGKVTDKSHTDVGSAFKGLDDNIKNVNARIKEVSEGV